MHHYDGHMAYNGSHFKHIIISYQETAFITPFTSPQSSRVNVLTKDGSIYELRYNEGWTKLKDWEEEMADKEINISFKVLHLKQNQNIS